MKKQAKNNAKSAELNANITKFELNEIPRNELGSLLGKQIQACEFNRERLKTILDMPAVTAWLTVECKNKRGLYGRICKFLGIKLPDATLKRYLGSKIKTVTTALVKHVVKLHKKGISNADIVEITGVSKQTVSRWIADSKKPAEQKTAEAEAEAETGRTATKTVNDWQAEAEKWKAEALRLQAELESLKAGLEA